MTSTDQMTEIRALKKALHEEASIGADLSPGNRLSEKALEYILALESEIAGLRKAGEWRPIEEARGKIYFSNSVSEGTLDGLTAKEWAKVVEIAWVVCNVSDCDGTRIRPCDKHFGAAEKLWRNVSGKMLPRSPEKESESNQPTGEQS